MAVENAQGFEGGLCPWPQGGCSSRQVLLALLHLPDRLCRDAGREQRRGVPESRSPAFDLPTADRETPVPGRVPAFHHQFPTG